MAQSHNGESFRAFIEEAIDFLNRKKVLDYYIANYIIPDRRDVRLGLAVYYHCARKLGLNPVDAFDEAAGYAGRPLADLLMEFGRRPDVNLRSFGWRELKTPEGVTYKFNFG